MSSASRFASDAPSESQEQAPAGRSKQAQPFSEALLKAPPHPTLVEPKLYVYGLKDSDISDQEVMKTLIHCLRARPKLERDLSGIKGCIEFEHLLNAEKAFATVQNVPLHDSCLSLAIHEPSSNAQDRQQPPESKSDSQTATSRLVKQLPQEWTASQIFELFRPFGPLRRVAIQLDPSSSNFTGLSVVEFYQEAHAAQAASHLHFSDQEGQTISVQPYETSKGPTRGLTQMMANWVQAPEFHPAAQQGYPYGPVQPPPEAVYGPPASYMTTPPAATSSWASPSGPAYMPQQPFQASPQASPGSNVPADPRNLFIKNLNPKISSQDLFQSFKRFGQIVSARVMRDEQTGNSKGFGFVSFTRTEDAAAAQITMDGQPLEGQFGRAAAILVRFHEPKRQREQKLRERFATPRARGGEFDQEAVLQADATRRLSGVVPSGSPPMPGSPPPGAKSLDNPGASSRSASPQAAGGSPMAPVSERDRMLSAVQRMGVPKAESIVGLLMTLSKKERALCLFNADVLRGKVHDAQSVIEASEGDETALVSKLENVSLEQNQLPTPQPTPERRSQKGSMGPSVSPALVSEITTAAGLAKLPAVKIIELAHSENPPPAIAIPSTETSQEIDTFVDGLLTKSVNEQKQKLGERLFKRIKELGVVKGAPKLTIHLLDTEDLRALAHLMAEQPEILKEKVNLIQLK